MNKNIDLTNEIQQFTDVVIKAAASTKNFKPTMIVRPFYVKRNELANWIPHQEVNRGKNNILRTTSTLNISTIDQSQIRGNKATNILQETLLLQ